MDFLPQFLQIFSTFKKMCVLIPCVNNTLGPVFNEFYKQKTLYTNEHVIAQKSLIYWLDPKLFCSNTGAKSFDRMPEMYHRFLYRNETRSNEVVNPLTYKHVLICMYIFCTAKFLNIDLSYGISRRQSIKLFVVT